METGISTIPLVDLKAQYRDIQDEIQTAMMNVIHTTSFIMGKEVAEFEQDFADFCGSKHAVGVSSGTAAIHLALRALGVGPGDEVITVPNTFFATVEAIMHCGAEPVFVDVDPEYFSLNPDLLEAAITPQTRAILPVHLYGQCADMVSILEIANRYNLPVVEDAAQAHGAAQYGRKAGTMGRIACFSFYPGKNLGAFGDAGAITTDDDDLADQIKRARDHGRKDKYLHLEVGYGERLDTLQAAILRVKLRHLSDWNRRRQHWAGCYTQWLEDIPEVRLPQVREQSEHVFHLYVIRTLRRDELSAYLKQQSIQVGVHDPVPLHLQPALNSLGFNRGDFPITEELSQTVLSLPIYPELREVEVKRIVDAIHRFFD